MPEEGLRVAVVGASGLVGGELLRLLAGHPEVAEVRAMARSAAGRRWGEVHPPLAHLPREGRFEALDLAALAGLDVVFLALPHGRSQHLLRDLPGNIRLLVALAADFRVPDRARYEAAYGPHACFEEVAGFRYGAADVLGTRLRGARRIAAPGCFATAAVLALWPFTRRGGIRDAACFAVTGSSGSGVEPRPTTHHPFRAHDLFAYRLDGHRHEAEVDAFLAREGPAPPLRLLAHSGPLVRGIHLTARLRPAEPVAEPLAVLRAAWAGRPFVRVLDAPPHLRAVVGTNFAHVHAAARDGGRDVVVTVAIDNLVKGAAGQAVQAANLALGLDEAAGLGFPGVHPC